MGAAWLLEEVYVGFLIDDACIDMQMHLEPTSSTSDALLVDNGVR